VRLAGNHVIPFLLKKGYMKSFIPEKVVVPEKVQPSEEIKVPEDTASTEEVNP
jgi:hypothetical protein